MAEKATKGWESERLTVLIGGDSGSGKSFFCANFKGALIFDTDLGGGLKYADERIKRNGSERIEASSWNEVESEIRKRASEQRLHKTIIIDHSTSLHQDAVTRHNPTGEPDFGASNRQATAEWRKLRQFVRNLGCNLIVTAHLKNEYKSDGKSMSVVGETVDSAKNIEGDVGVVLHLKRPKSGSPTRETPSIAIVRKWRRDPDDTRGVVTPVFPFTVENFVKIAGIDFDAGGSVTLASKEDVEKVIKMLALVKIPETTIKKWFTAAGTDNFEDFTDDQIKGVLKHLGKQMEVASKGESHG